MRKLKELFKNVNFDLFVLAVAGFFVAIVSIITLFIHDSESKEFTTEERYAAKMKDKIAPSVDVNLEDFLENHGAKVISNGEEEIVFEINKIKGVVAKTDTSDQPCQLTFATESDQNIEAASPGEIYYVKYVDEKSGLYLTDIEVRCIDYLAMKGEIYTWPSGNAYPVEDDIKISLGSEPVGVKFK